MKTLELNSFWGSTPEGIILSNKNKVLHDPYWGLADVSCFCFAMLVLGRVFCCFCFQDVAVLFVSFLPAIIMINLFCFCFWISCSCFMLVLCAWIFLHFILSGDGSLPDFA